MYDKITHSLSLGNISCGFRKLRKKINTLNGAIRNMNVNLSTSVFIKHWNERVIAIMMLDWRVSELITGINEYHLFRTIKVSVFKGQIRRMYSFQRGKKSTLLFHLYMIHVNKTKLESRTFNKKKWHIFFRTYVECSVYWNLSRVWPW